MGNPDITPMNIECYGCIGCAACVLCTATAALISLASSLSVASGGAEIFSALHKIDQI